MKSYFVYILHCNDNSFYVGLTSELEERISQHNSGKFPEAFTCYRRPVSLKWFEKFKDPKLASALEKQIKGWSRRKKEALINGEWDKLKDFSKNYSQFGKPD